MLLGALGSARAGTAAGVALLDRGADRVARASSPAMPLAGPGRPRAGVRETGEQLGGAVDGVVGGMADGLVDGMVDLVLSRTLVAANAATARRADEAYRSVLGLLER